MKLKISLQICATLLLITSTVFAGSVNISKGQTLYVASYPHVYVSQKMHDFPITVTLNIRNLSDKQLKLTAVDYYHGDGRLLKRYVDKVLVLDGMKSIRYLGEKMKVFENSSGPYFLVKWESEVVITVPLVETLMIGASGTQGISFTHRADTIKEK